MRPVPIAAEEVWEGGRRVVVAPPGGDLTNPDIQPVEAVVDAAFDGTPRFCIKLALEPGDFEKLLAGGDVWIAFYGVVVPFALDVKGPGE